MNAPAGKGALCVTGHCGDFPVRFSEAGFEHRS